MSEIVEKYAEQLAERYAEQLAEKRIVEEKKASACRLIARGKMTLEEIAEDTDLPLEEIRELAGLQLA